MPQKSSDELREDAVSVWKAGVDAVDSARLVRDQVTATPDDVSICGHRWPASGSGRICVVGAGKAGAGMAAGLEEALGSEWLARTTGWVNVPDDCVRSLETIHLHPARPAGVNEPTEQGVAGTREILKRVGDLGPDDLCLVLISGGGSALLPAPAEGITLADKQEVTRALMRCGATIDELNLVRRALSEVKGGGLLRACRAGMLVALIISDVIGDPLETIASGPTVDVPPDPQGALAVLKKYQNSRGVLFPLPVMNLLTRRQMSSHAPMPEGRISMTMSTGDEEAEPRDQKPAISPHGNHVIGNNRTAVEAAANRARQLGYEVRETEWDVPGIASEFGRSLARRAWELKQTAAPGQLVALLSGGEPTVHVVQTETEQKGGRNQELVLAAVETLMDELRSAESGGETGIVLLSGGTDGEDGPTDAAGAILDDELLRQVRETGTDPRDYLQVNNSYPFFEQFDRLLKTGPTHTNVMDLRVVLIQT
jgi:glycerate 2-kinase